MGSAQAQSQVWGVQARNWADLMEKMVLPVYHVVLDKTNVGRGTHLLDVGCGTGMAAQLAAKLGAQVTGLDASEAELVIARERVPNGDFRCGEMEELPYADASFDVVTGFNSLQFADETAWKTINSSGPLAAAVRCLMAETCAAGVPSDSSTPVDVNNSEGNLSMKGKEQLVNIAEEELKCSRRNTYTP